MIYKINRVYNKETFPFNVEIRRCTIEDIDKIYNLQNVVIESLDNKDYFLPFDEADYKNVLEQPTNYGNIYGCFRDSKLIAWVFLAIKESIVTRVSQHIEVDNTKRYADLDGIIVHPEYRGNGLQLLLMKYTEEKAKEQGIDFLLGEITEGNIYSVNNFLNYGYKKVGELVKNDSFKREIYIKKI